MNEKIRVLIAKAGLDGHDRGAIVISQALRDHGMEVIYTGLRQTPKQIAKAAVQEDVDVIGLSSLSGAHNTLFPQVIEELKKLKAEDIPVIGGGVIPAEDIPYLKSKGIKQIFTSGSSTELLADYIKNLVHPNKENNKLKKIAHIGIAVRSIDEALPFYVNTLGLELEQVESVPSEGVKVAFLTIGDGKLELLEPINESSPIQKFIDKRGEGIHHIAFEVDDIHGRISNLLSSGVHVLNEEPKLGAGNNLISFLHPKQANGVLIELCQQQQEGDE